MNGSSKHPLRILIVGGGTAGWMTANTLLHKWPGADISLVESKDIGTVGVGEGATPYLKEYFRSLDIQEHEWMPACDATYKAGIIFEDWSTVSGYESYFHPFFSVLDKQPAELFFHNAGLRRRGFDANALPDNYFVASQIAKLGLAPRFNQPTDADIDYAYHFDAAKLGHFLRDRAIHKGLVHIVDDVEEVRLNDIGEIADVVTRVNGPLSADLYVDCTGFRALLINQALKEQYQSYSNQLFNDSAVAIQTPKAEGNMLAQTRSIALTNGWMWQIPLTSRQGNGYVYSSQYLDKDDAETELRRKLKLDDNADISARHLKMRIGRLENHWSRNCLAVGLSQGFIEPLEATALMLIQFTVERFVEHYGAGDRAGFNSSMNQTFDGVRDYIVAHYKLNSRNDSQYWIDNRENNDIPDSLAHLIEAWTTGVDFEKALSEVKQQLVYLRPSWYCILAGMGMFPDKLKSTQQQAPVDQAVAFCQQAANHYFVQHQNKLDELRALQAQ